MLQILHAYRALSLPGSTLQESFFDPFLDALCDLICDGGRGESLTSELSYLVDTLRFFLPQVCNLVPPASRCIADNVTANRGLLSSWTQLIPSAKLTSLLSGALLALRHGGTVTPRLSPVRLRFPVPTHPKA